MNDTAPRLTPIRRRAAAAALLTLLAVVAMPLRAADAPVVIREPQADVTVHDNNGDLRVVVELARPLDAARESVVIYLDGSVAAQGTATAYTLSGIDRGTHQLQAAMLDAGGATRASSAPVVFHMWRASRLFPPSKPLDPHQPRPSPP
jgi:type IV secretory pathway protease TraF